VKIQTPDLAADCDSCFALCCVLLPFAAGSGFGLDKPGGTPCPNLADDDRCSIHATLREDGWAGCTIFDCFGAGQQVSQVTYAGVSWREHDNLGEMAAVLSVMRQLHEMLAHLTEVRARLPDAAAPSTAYDEIVRLTATTPDDLLAVDIDELRERVSDVLADASRQIRGADAPAPGRDLAGRDLRRTDVRRADLRGTLLIRADLRDCDLTDTDLLGADVRDADARGADLTHALFVSQAQLNALRGDSLTRIPTGRTRPGHWS
jgi:uncharacterized protein YjbI with pentapeptide repeats